LAGRRVVQLFLRTLFKKDSCINRGIEELWKTPFSLFKSMPCVALNHVQNRSNRAGQTDNNPSLIAEAVENPRLIPKFSPVLFAAF
jgi:hypothetical protein